MAQSNVEVQILVNTPHNEGNEEEFRAEWGSGTNLQEILDWLDNDFSDWTSVMLTIVRRKK